MKKNKDYIIYIVYEELKLYTNKGEFIKIFKLSESSLFECYKYIINNFKNKTFSVLIESSSMLNERRIFSQKRKDISIKRIKKSNLLMTYFKRKNQKEYNILKLKDFSKKKTILKIITILSQSRLNITRFDLIDIVLNEQSNEIYPNEEKETLVVTSKRRSNDSYTKIIATQKEVILLERTIQSVDQKDEILATKKYLESRYSKTYKFVKWINISSEAELNSGIEKEDKCKTEILNINPSQAIEHTEDSKDKTPNAIVDNWSIRLYLNFIEKKNKDLEYVSTNKNIELNKKKIYMQRAIKYISLTSCLAMLIITLLNFDKIKKIKELNQIGTKNIKKMKRVNNQIIDQAEFGRIKYFEKIIEHDKNSPDIDLNSELNKISDALKKILYLDVSSYTVKTFTNKKNDSLNYDIHLETTVYNESGFQSDIDKKVNEIKKTINSKLNNDMYELEYKTPKRTTSIKPDKFELKLSLKIKKIK